MGTHDLSSLDSAAVFGAALSLWQSVRQRANAAPRTNLSECYNGGDEFMREVMRVAMEFEGWADANVRFAGLDDVWPYLLEDRFGEACVDVLGGIETLMHFDEHDCLRVAIKLRLPLRDDTGLPVPVDVTAPFPRDHGGFVALRIQTVRDLLGDDAVEPFTADGDPFDEAFGTPYFGLYGIDADGVVEHIADRTTYANAVDLAEKLAPGIRFLAPSRLSN